MVIIPDYYRGMMINPMTSSQDQLMEFVKTKTQWEGSLKNDWEEKVHPYALKHGAKVFGAIGKSGGDLNRESMLQMSTKNNGSFFKSGPSALFLNTTMLQWYKNIVIS